MSLEIEAKFRVASHEPVRERLKAAGAAFIEHVVETNRILDRPDGFLMRQGCGLRVRTAVPVGGTRGTDDKTPLSPPLVRGDAAVTSRSTLTYKGPRRPGAIKSREEIEVEVENGETLVHILATIGFVMQLCYEKKRESWSIGGCRVELDEPAVLGLFVEIEGPDEAAIEQVRQKLGLNPGDMEPDSYVSLLAAYCREKGIKDRRLRIEC